MTLLTAADRLEAELPESAARIRAYVREVQQKDLRITQRITDAKGDRSRPPAQQDDPDAYVRVVERRPDGIVIRGAKLHISAASMGHELMVRHLHDIAGGSVLTAPGMADLDNPDTGDLVRKYMSTAGSVDGEYRTRLFHAIRDLTADALGGWNAVTNIQAGGGLYAQRIVSRMHYDLERAKRLALERTGLADPG